MVNLNLLARIENPPIKLSTGELYDAFYVHPGNDIANSVMIELHLIPTSHLEKDRIRKIGNWIK